MTKLPLSGVRVLDLTSVIMGPLATRILADLGAEVIKIESDDGDLLRKYLPARNRGMSGVFLNLNRNKKSVIIDLKSRDGQDQLHRLIPEADILIHSLRPNSAQALHLDYETIAAINPGIIYCGAYGFGSGGRYAHKAAYDDIIQAGSGLAALATAFGRSPSYLPTVLCDKLTGQVIAYSVLAALYQKQRDGIGQCIEVPMFEASVDFVMVEHMAGTTFEPPLDRPGWARALNPNRKPFKTADGYCCILPYSDRNWRDFLTFAARHDLVDDPRLVDLPTRTHNISFLYDLIEELAPTMTSDEWVAKCDAVGIPCMPVLSLEELEHDPHLKEVELFHLADHPTEGRYRYTRPPARMSKAPFAVRHHAPRLGEHTEEILGVPPAPPLD